MRPDRLVLWLTLLIAIAVTAIEWWRRRRPKGFTDWLKNPREFGGTFVGPEEIEALTARAREIDTDTLRKIVRKQIWKGKRDGVEERVLRGVGRPVQRLVLEILADTSLHPKLAKVRERSHRTDSPLERACELLEGPPACPDAVPLLAPFLDHGSEDIRRFAAHAIAFTGAPESIPLARKSLADGNDYVRTNTLYGIESARSKGRLGPEALRELAPDFQRCIASHQNVEYAARLLLHADRASAIEFLLNPEFFHAGYPELHRLLKGLLSHAVVVPRDRLQELVLTLEAGPLEYPADYAVSDALQLLGLQRQPGDREFIEARLSHSNSTVASGAADAMLAWAGLAELDQKLWRFVKGRPLAELPEPVGHYLAVSALDGEVNNGGFAQYYFNPSGNDWREAMAGLEAMGFVKRLELLRETVRRFGADAPSGDREMRQEQLSWLVRKNDKIFRDLDDAYFQSTENVAVFISRYVIARSDELQRAIASESGGT